MKDDNMKGKLFNLLPKTITHVHSDQLDSAYACLTEYCQSTDLEYSDVMEITEKSLNTLCSTSPRRTLIAMQFWINFKTTYKHWETKDMDLYKMMIS